MRMRANLMISKRALVRLSLISLLSSVIPMLVSCDSNTITLSGDTDTQTFVIQPPAALLATRMVDVENLTLEVLVDNNAVVMDQSGADGEWVGSIDLAPAVEYQLQVTWIESFKNEKIRLSRASKPVQIQANDPAPKIEIFESDFNGDGFDFDSDGRSNLDERNAGSDPIDRNSPEAPPRLVTVEVQFNLPASFQSQNIDSSMLIMEAFANNQNLNPTLSGLTWSGATLLLQNTDVPIRADLFSDITKRVKLGVIQETRNVGEGGPIVILDTDFDFEFDSDTDGFTNLEEILDGFEETETADDDGDTIPNYRESNIIDADEDLFFSHDDEDENDPCVPSDSSFACINMP